MGEYAKRKSDGVDIKIGTCESMYYLRWDDRHKVTPLPGSLNPATEANLYWRLPLPEEDGILPGAYESHDKSITLLPWEEEDDRWKSYEPDDDVEAGNIQLHHESSGLLLNVKCYHGVKLPYVGADVKAFWNGKASHNWELCFIKNHQPPDGQQELRPLVRCRHCGSMFREQWVNVLPHIQSKPLRDRLFAYAYSNLPSDNHDSH